MKITMPTPEEHARKLAYGLTKYAYEEVRQSIEEAQQIEQQYQQAMNDACAIVEPFEIIPFARAAMPAHLRDLDIRLEQIHLNVPAFEMGQGRELYTIPTWRKEVASYRRAIKQIEKAVKEAKQHPVVDVREWYGLETVEKYCKAQ